MSVGALANGGAASDIGAGSSAAANLALNGGTLQYTGSGASIDRLFTLGTTGGAIDNSGSGALNLNNSGPLACSGTGPRTLTLTGAEADDNTLAAALANNGGPTAVTKSGAGKWILSGTNTYSGVTTIAAGTLQVGAGGASGSPGPANIIDNGALVFNRSGTLTVSGVISGSGSVTNNGAGTVILAANNSYIGGTTINAGTLQIGSGGATGSLNGDTPIVDNGTLIFDSTSPFTLAGFNAVISGTGNVWVRGSGLVKAIGNNTYTGWTTIDAGATFQPCEGNQGQLLSSVVTNNGTLKLVRQDFGPPVFGYTNNIVGTGQVLKDVNNVNQGEVLFLGTNTYTGGTIIAGGGIVLGDGATTGAGSIVGVVIFTNSSVQDTLRTLQFNRPDDFTFTNTIIGAVTGSPVGNSGVVIQNGGGTVTLTGNNTYPGGTTINSGTVQVGNGGTSGSLGTGPVTDSSLLVWNRAADATFGGVISGTGSVVKMGAGTLTLTALNTFSGSTTISNGTLTISAVASPGSTNSLAGGVDMFGGTLVVGGVGSVSALEMQGVMNIYSGTVVASLNTALSPSNTFYSVLSGVNVTSGTLKLINAGPQLVVGQKFTIFSQPVIGGADLTIVSPGFTFANNLAVDGSVTVTAVKPPPTITTAVSGNQLNLSWPSAWTGSVHLQVQTNSISIGLSTNWVTIAGTDASNFYSTTINQTNGCVFYRLITL